MMANAFGPQNTVGAMGISPSAVAAAVSISGRNVMHLSLQSSVSEIFEAELQIRVLPGALEFTLHPPECVHVLFQLQRFRQAEKGTRVAWISPETLAEHRLCFWYVSCLKSAAPSDSRMG